MNKYIKRVDFSRAKKTLGDNFVESKLSVEATEDLKEEVNRELAVADPSGDVDQILEDNEKT